MAGEYTAPPAHGPMIALICGTTPLGERVAQEDVGVAGERLDALLDARAARVVEADDRRADLHREVHHLADLLGVRARERAAEHGEVLREDEDLAAVDGAVAGDDAVAEDLLLLHAEVGAAVGDELVELDEASPGRAGASMRSRAVSLPASCCLSMRAWPPASCGLGFHLLETRDRIFHSKARIRRGVANVKGSALSSRILWVQLEHGEAGFERLLHQVSPELRGYHRDGRQQGPWYPFDQFVELNVVTRPAVRRRATSGSIRELGRFGADANLKTIYRLFYKVGSVHWILGRAVRLWSAHYDSGFLEVATRGPRAAILRMRGFATPHRAHCLSVLGWAERSIELSGGKRPDGRDEVPHARRRALPARRHLGLAASVIAPNGIGSRCDVIVTAILAHRHVRAGQLERQRLLLAEHGDVQRAAHRPSRRSRAADLDRGSCRCGAS